MRRAACLMVLFTFCYLLPATALAQTRAAADVGLSYSFLRGIEGDGVNVPVGWLVSPARSMNSWLGVVGEVAGNYKIYEDGDTLWVHTFQGGVRLASRANPNVTPFGQFLLGGIHVRGDEGGGNVDSETHFSIEPGGGVDVPLRGRMSARIAVGFPMFFVENETVNLFRLHVGVVFGIGNP